VTHRQELPPVAVRIVLEKSGWGSVEVAVGERRILMHDISYGTPVLADLAKAGLAACLRAPRSVTRFDCEPAEWRLIVEDSSLGDRPQWTVRILRFRDCQTEVGDFCRPSLSACSLSLTLALSRHSVLLS